jgi:translocation and assembly module TamA
MLSLKAHIRASSLIALLALTVYEKPAMAFEIFGMKFFEDEDDAAAVSDPVRYSLNFDPGEDDLRKDLEGASLLFQEQEKPVSGDLGVVIKARDDRDRLLAALYEQARYGAVIDIDVNGVPIDDLPPVPDFPRDRAVPVTVKVEPGPVFRLAETKLGADAAKFDPGDLGLKTGDAVGAGQVITAAGRVVENLEKEGRPLAALTGRELAADHKTNETTVTINAEGGPVADYGDVSIKGSRTVDPEFIRQWARLNTGERYDPEKVKEATERLRKLGVFSSIAITKTRRLDQSGRIPLAITVADGKQRYFGAGAEFSTIDGIGLSAYWGHRNLFGGAESLKISGAVSRLGSTLDWKELGYDFSILFSKPAAFNQITTFNAGVIAKNENPDAYRASTISIFANTSFDVTSKDVATAGVDLTANRTKDVFGKNDYLIASAPLSWARDATDNPLDATEGYKLNLSAIPSYEALEGTPFSSFEGSVSGYWGLGEENGVVLAGKLSLGTLVGVDQLKDVPAIRRFYAGGGGSVRGYAYQEISPRNGDGDATGGRSYAITSMEARVKVTEKISVVPFIDIASVNKALYPDFSDFRAGYGVGFRYATGLGPIRVDVALPSKKYDGGSSFGIYAGIGQSF